MQDLEKYIKDFSNSRTMDTIVIHCSATKRGMNFTSKDIKKWHLSRGFKDIGYHFVILLDGTIEIGRPLNIIGSHVSGYNTGSIGICYVGGLDYFGKPDDTRTNEQKESLIKLIKLLKENINIKEVKGHRDFSKDLNNNGVIEKIEYIKDCPCFNAIEEYESI